MVFATLPVLVIDMSQIFSGFWHLAWYIDIITPNSCIVI